MVTHSDGPNCELDLQKIATLLGTGSAELARTLGLDEDAMHQTVGPVSDDARRRAGKMMDVLGKVEPRFGSVIMAYAWYRSEPLAGFSGQTAMELVLRDRAEDVLTYIDAVNVGVQA